MKGKSEKVKCSSFLYTVGQTGRDIYNTTMTYLEEEQDKIDILFSKFEAYYKPNNQALPFQYTCTRQTETIDQYMTELRLIAKNCSFGNLEVQLVRDRLVCYMNSEEVHQRLLKVEELTLDKAISICRTHKETKKNAQYLNDSSTIEVCDLKKKSVRPTQRNSTSTEGLRLH